jgi:hydroxymethylpyrimidine/phosphomethylpyrimidine kinase
MQSAICELLFPQATIITPNSIEARRLAFYDEGDEVKHSALEECAQRLLGMGSEYVLITGTHERSADVVNSLYGTEGLVRDYHWERLKGSYHGSGCTLTSAIAACLAHGLTVEEALQEAQEYTWQTLKNAFRPGMGQFIPDRFFWARDEGNVETSFDKPSSIQH